MCYNFASSCKSIVMFLILISNIVFLVASMSFVVLQMFPHLQKLDGFTLQADVSRDYSTNLISNMFYVLVPLVMVVLSF